VRSPRKTAGIPDNHRAYSEAQPGRAGREANLTTMTTVPAPAGFLHLVVGYDGSPPATRALDAATRLLQGRVGHIHVVYVTHPSSLAMMSPGAMAEIEEDFEEIEKELRASAAEELRASGADWQFERRPGLVAGELVAAATAIRDAHPRRDRVGHRRKLVPRRPPGGRFGRGRPGPPFAGPPGDRAVATVRAAPPPALRS